MRAWLPPHSQLGLELRLALSRRKAEVLALLAPARDMKQLDKAGESTPIALAGEHRRPARIIIFVADIAAVVARVEGLDPRRQAEWRRPAW